MTLGPRQIERIGEYESRRIERIRRRMRAWERPGTAAARIALGIGIGILLGVAWVGVALVCTWLGREAATWVMR